MNERSAVLAVLAVLSTLSFGSAADAFGILVGDRSTNNSNVLASRTLVAQTSSGEIVQMTEIHYQRDQLSSFLWLLPVAAEGEVRVDACEDVFGRLDDLSQPRILLRHRDYGGEGSCGGDRQQEVTLSTIGAHEYSGIPVDPQPPSTVVGPFNDLTELRDWLLEREFLIPPSAAGVLDHYVGYSWQFMAMPVDSTLTTGNLCVELTYTPPSQRSYSFLLPFKSVSVSTPSDSEVLIYTLGRGRSRPYISDETQTASYYSTILNHDGILYMGDDRTSYAELFREAIVSGPAPTFVVEYSGGLSDESLLPEIEDRWLTRLRIRLDPAMVPDGSGEFDSDLALELMDEEPVERDYQIIVASREAAPMTLVCFAVALVGVSIFSRRKR